VGNSTAPTSEPADVPAADEVVDLSAPANETRKSRQVAGGWEWEAFRGWRRRQIPDVGPTPYLPVEWFGGCSGSYFYATEEEAWEDAGRRALEWGRSQAACPAACGT